MGKEKFLEAAPKYVAEAFAEVGAAAVDGVSFEAAHNIKFTQMINKVGKTLFNETAYNNPLESMYQDSMPYGSIVEMISVEVDSWTDDMTSGQYPNRDKLKEYAAKVSASYSELTAVAKAPVTIYDKAIRVALTSMEATDKFFTSHLVAMRNGLERQRFLLGKELIHRMLTDDVSADRHLTITGVTAIGSKEDALKVWAKINEIVSDMQISTKKYNKAGVSGQVPVVNLEGQAGVEIIADSKTLALLQTYASDIFNETNLNMHGIKFVKVDDFGGLTPVAPDAPAYSTEDGSQIADLSDGTTTWLNPHDLTKFVIVERGALVATTDWEDVETTRISSSRATTYDPQSKHTFAALPFKAFCELKFAAGN